MSQNTEKVHYRYKSKPKMPDKLSLQAKLFVRVSWVLWGISLLLPGIWMESNREFGELLPGLLTDSSGGFTEGLILSNAHFGFEILLLWGPFAWVAGGFAVYANIFYWIVQYKLAVGKRANISIILMLVLAASAFLVRRIPMNESGATAEIAKWGCGVFVWDMALILLAAAAWDKRPYHSAKQALLPYAAAFLAIWIVMLI